MLRKIDWVYVVAGGLAVGTIANLCTEYIDKTEESKAMRVWKKIGIYSGCLAAGGLITNNLVSGNMAAAYYKGTMRIKLNV